MSTWKVFVKNLNIIAVPTTVVDLIHSVSSFCEGGNQKPTPQASSVNVDNNNVRPCGVYNTFVPAAISGTLCQTVRSDRYDLKETAIGSEDSRTRKHHPADQQQEENILIVKYGGSAITKKNQFETLRPSALATTADQIASLWHQPPNHTDCCPCQPGCNKDKGSVIESDNIVGGRRRLIILVHGAGSFGHFQAKEFGLKHGGRIYHPPSLCGETNSSGPSSSIFRDQNWQYGLAVTRHSVQRLNRLVVEAHITRHLPAVSVSLFPSTVTAVGAFSTLDPGLDTGKDTVHASMSLHDGGDPVGSLQCISLEPNSGPLKKEVVELARQGFIPIVHGDAVLDCNQRCSIFGGDQIILRLCEQLLAPDQMDTPNMTASTMAGVDNDRGASASMGTSMSSVWATAVNSPGPTTITQIKMLDSIAKPQPQSQPVRECARVRVVFLTDVAGVFDRAPHLPGARLIPHIIVNRDGSTNISAETEVASHDVTGGIEAKLQAAVFMALLGAEVFVVQVGTEHALKALRGERPAVGTVISLL